MVYKMAGKQTYYRQRHVCTVYVSLLSIYASVIAYVLLILEYL